MKLPLIVALVAGVALLDAADTPQRQVSLPTGQSRGAYAGPGARFEPLLTRIGPNPGFIADGASAMALSPRGDTLLVLTSGYNRYNGADGKIVEAQSTQYVFVYRIDRDGAHWAQTLQVPNSFSGIAWRPDSQGFAVGGGVDDDVHLFARRAEGFAAAGAPVKLGHAAGNGAEVKPQAAGVAFSPDGTRLLVANYYNDSVSLIDVAGARVLAEQDLRPGKIDRASHGQPGGEYPFALVWRDQGRAYVSSSRDRELIALDVAGDRMRVAKRIATVGQPTALLIDAGAGRLYATEDNADRLAMIDLARDRLIGEPQLALPASLGVAPGRGLNPNALALGPAGRLLVTYGGANAVALVAPDRDSATVEGLVPTGWYPSAVAADARGRVYVANRKSPPGPNPRGCAPKLAATQTQPTACGAANEYVFQLEKAGLLQFPMPTGPALARTTLAVADNIGVGRAPEREAAELRMSAIRDRIRHVIFIVKENRTYDQVLGDLEVGNGDPRLAVLGRALSPNHHQLARQFVTLDNFYDSGEQSSTGWTWTTAGRTTDLMEKTASVNYAQRGLSYESEQLDRNIAPGLPFSRRRATNPRAPDDDDVLPGPALQTGPDGPDGERGAGYIWNQALRVGLSVRNYGWSDASVYDDKAVGAIPPIRDPFAEHRPIYTPAAAALAAYSDPYFRGFDQKLADYWREREWEREFADQERRGTMPALTLMRLSHDHFGAFGKDIDGVGTVETQMADNDYAVGLLIERVARSRYADSTLVFVIEDDAQNGADHIDAHRSVAFIVGPYVRQGAVVSTRYTTVNFLRTIEAVLGLAPMGMNDALAAPMADVFDPGQRQWTYRARAATVLRETKLPIAPERFASEKPRRPVRTAAYWARVMARQRFDTEDKLDTDAFNKALWRGLSDAPMPVTRSGANLRHDRTALLAAAR